MGGERGKMGGGGGSWGREVFGGDGELGGESLGCRLSQGQITELRYTADLREDDRRWDLLILLHL